jgi:cytosine/adenosine deaminase-related metal-dependent hydrolase
LSGEFDLLSELRVAAESNQLSPQSLFQTVTTAAARLLRLDQGGRGRIGVGGTADLVLLPPLPAADKFSLILNLDRSQLELVMVAGKPRVGSPRMRTVFEATRTKFTAVLVDQVEKLLAEKLGTRLKKSSVQEPGLIL